MRATLVPLLARAAPAVRPSIAARSPSRWVAMSAKGKGKKGGDANDAKDGYGGEASVGKATGGQTSADALTAAALKEAGISVILGSKSFTRKAILKEMGIPYEVAVADIDEKAIGDRTDSPKDLVMAIAVAKADAIVKKMGEELGPDMDGQWPIAKDTMLVTCDQVVVHDGVVREKPESKDQAREFIRGYGVSAPSTVGATVVTDLETGGRCVAFDRSTVTFAPVPEETVEFLVQEGECMNCAGGLMAEHPKMAPLVTELNGAMDSIMGLGKRVVGGLLMEALLDRKLKGLSGGIKKEFIPEDQRVEKS